MIADWLVPAVTSFVGGLIGAGLGYLTSERSLRQSKRDEWGWRLTIAADKFGAQERRNRVLGRTMLQQLLESDLATANDKAVARSLLENDAKAGVDPAHMMEDELSGDDVSYIVRDDRGAQ